MLIATDNLENITARQVQEKPFSDYLKIAVLVDLVKNIYHGSCSLK